eukprot:s370_g28.t1
MSDSDILEAFQKYCHPEVVSEFQQLGPQHQQVWLDTFWATCHRKVNLEACDRVALESFLANPQTQDPSEIDLASVLKQMQRSSTASSGADSCPLLRALKPHIKLDQSLWEALLGPRQDFLPWGKKRSRQELMQRHQMGLLSTKLCQESLRQNSDLATIQRSDATTQKPMATMKSWTSLKPSLFANLPVLMVAEGKMVNCRVVDHPFIRTAVQALVEDAQGQVMPLQLYNQLPEGEASLDEVMSKFAKGTELSIAEPFASCKFGHERWLPRDSRGCTLTQAHQKAGLRYAAALKKCAELLAEEGGKEDRSMLPLAKRAATLYPAAAQGVQGDQSDQGDRIFLAKPAIDSIVLINSHGSHEAEDHQGTDHSGIFPSACLFNHSSDANCAFASVKLRDGSKVPEILAVMTIRAVKEGEELNVCYSQDMHAENAWGIRQR